MQGGGLPTALLVRAERAVDTLYESRWVCFLTNNRLFDETDGAWVAVADALAGLAGGYDTDN